MLASDPVPTLNQKKTNSVKPHPTLETLEKNMELADIPGTALKISRIAIGIGGWMWGGTDESESVSTIPYFPR